MTIRTPSPTEEKGATAAFDGRDIPQTTSDPSSTSSNGNPNKMLKPPASAGDSRAIPPTVADDKSSANSASKKMVKLYSEREWPTIELSFAGRVASGIVNLALDTFFSKIEVVNNENIDAEGPVLLFGNHNNQFLDPMVMTRAAERPVSFIGAAVSLNKPVIGHLGRALQAIPVVRPQDKAYPGSGQLASVDLESRTITGKGSKFTDEVRPGFMVGNKVCGRFVVEEVESDTRLTFRPLSKGDVAEPTLVSENSAYKITPKVNHKEMFEKVYEALNEGKCVGIFPEGGSHDQTHLLELKAGIAIMALGALAQNVPVRVVPVGINYFSGHIWRSKCFVEVGKPVEVSQELVDMYKVRETRHEACSKLLVKLKTALDLVTLTAPDFETLKVIRTARRMYQGKVELTPKEYIDLNLRFSHMYYKWHDKEPEFMQLMNDIREYLEFCRGQNLKDKDVRDLPPLGSWRTLLNAVYDFAMTVVLILFMLPLALPGVLLNLPIPLYARYKVPKAMKRALENSSVKIAARDVAASQQVMLSIKMILPLHVFYSILWVIFFYNTWQYYERGDLGFVGHMFVSNSYWFLPLCFIFLGPYYSFYITPKLVEVTTRRLRLLPRYLFCIKSFFNAGKRQPAELLRFERKKLMVRVQDLVETLIVQHPEFSRSRVINRKKIVKNRSKSIKEVARGDLTPRLLAMYKTPSIEKNLSRFSFGNETDEESKKHR